MDLHQLKTFVTVAREGSVTRASSLLHLSQPAVSAHIKAMEDALGLSLFERTARGMSLTPDGQRLLAKAEQTLAAHQALMDEATRSKGELTGKLRVGAGSNSSHEAIGRLLSAFAERHAAVEVSLLHRSSREILEGLRNGTLDAGFYNEPGEAEPDLATLEVARFTIHVAAAPGSIASTPQPDWRALAGRAWIYPSESACCSRTAERLFAAQRFRPQRVISADRQDVVRTLIGSGLGVGLLHEDVAKAAQGRGEIVLLFEAEEPVRILFAHLERRASEPLLAAAAAIMRALPRD